MLRVSSSQHARDLATHDTEAQEALPRREHVELDRLHGTQLAQQHCTQLELLRPSWEPTCKKHKKFYSSRRASSPPPVAPALDCQALRERVQLPRKAAAECRVTALCASQGAA